MKTEKLYYKDAYIKDFTATVLICEPHERGYAVVLDKTAFFPQEGGQSADTGKIENIEVYDVQEVSGTIYHYTSEPLSVGACVRCEINFAERFEKMQCHTAEHILSGILHSEYGVENTGFHLGHEDITFDTSSEMTREELASVERLANIAVQRNLPVVTLFPTPEQLSQLTYRSKLELTEDVRIVNIGDVDSCACCAPHVAYTGEIGMIRLVDSVKHKGGSRIRMLAGMRAYNYVTAVMREASAVSVALSAPMTEISDALNNLTSKKDALSAQLSQMGRDMAQLLADAVEPTNGSLAVYYPMLDTDALRSFVNSAAKRVGGTLVVLAGSEGNYKYILHDSSENFAERVKKANAALGGKGGGRAPMAQGSYTAPLDAILEYFK